MAKTKNKKQKFANHKQKEVFKQNPFEIHINNEKLRVLNRKRKNDIGKPGLSKSKAILKRKQTLLQEYKVLNKTNKFSDRRIGESNNNLSLVEKQMARFAAIRVKQHHRKQKYNLGDDEILTHKGQTLSEIEKFENPASDEDDDEEETGKLDKQFVEEAHFGGGMLKKIGDDGAKTHKDLINELILESKKRKAEMQKNKEATMELTEKLDSEWKDLLPIVTNKMNNEEPAPTPKVDDYDKVMRELKFEARGTVSDRLKSEEEIAKEEKEKLEQLEKERLERMNGITTNSNQKVTHRSADDLDDGFVYESVGDVTLSYNESGKSNVNVTGGIIKTTPNEHSEDENESEAGSEENEEEEDSDEESDDNLSDLKEDTSDSELSDQEELDNDENNLNDECKNTANSKEPENVEQKNEIVDQTIKLTEVNNEKDELPYTFSLPSTYKNLYDILINKSAIHQGVIIERMIKCNHSSLAAGNKKNLGLLFAYILQYLNDIFSESAQVGSVPDSFKLFESLCPHLYELAQMDHANAHNSIKEIIKEKFKDYFKKEKEYPGLENLIFLKLVSLLFTTSDFRHQIVTPCFIFMEQILSRCRIVTKSDIAYGLFLVTLILEYTSLSKRYLPAAINYLGGVLHMAIPKTVKVIKVLKPFKITSSDLVVIEDHSNTDFSLKMDVSHLGETKIDEIFKIKALHLSINLLKEFLEHFKDLPSCVEIFQPISQYLHLIPLENYPISVKNNLKELQAQIENMDKNRFLRYIVMPDKKPKALRLYEPKVEEIYDRKKHKVQSKQKAERDKLLHKLKREKKGALREIRRDNSFLSRFKLSQQIKSDQERKEKVKRIFSEASIQQSELNQLDRKRKKK